jgi:cell division initiation protein
MSLTAEDVQNKIFEHEKHGYSIDQVDEFLSIVENEVGAMNEQIAEAEDRNASLQARVNELETKLAEYQGKITDYEGRLSEQKEDDSVISNAIISAQRSAEAIKKEARERGEKVYRDAEAKSREILRDALSEKQRTLEEVERLKDSRARFQTEYLALLHKFLEQADQAFPENPNAAATTGSSAGSHSAPESSSDPDATIASPAAQPGVSAYGETDDVDVDDID